DYEVPESCRGSGPTAGCEKHSLYVRCETMDSFLSANHGRTSKSFLELKAALDRIETRIGELLFSETGIEKTERAEFSAALGEILKSNEAALQSLMKTFSNSPENEIDLFLWESIRRRAGSLDKQLEMVSGTASIFEDFF
ncbi:MAG: hypothetical protein ABL958_10710, partial [Bdellovibrionia bacterium]